MITWFHHPFRLILIDSSTKYYLRIVEVLVILLQTDLMILECGKQRNGFKINCKIEKDSWYIQTKIGCASKLTKHKTISNMIRRFVKVSRNSRVFGLQSTAFSLKVWNLFEWCANTNWRAAFKILSWQLSIHSAWVFVIILHFAQSML